MKDYDSLVQPAAIVFKDGNCRGVSAAIMGPTEYGKYAYYNNQDLSEAYYYNDSMSSIMIPMGVSV